jgi:toxin ParE1/3/4
MTLILSPAAQIDIDRIWDHSAEQWGEEHAEAYIGDLRRSLEQIGRNPNLGRSCDEVRSGYRQRLARSHVIFYRIVGVDVDVVRILHQRMDARRHL